MLTKRKKLSKKQIKEDKLVTTYYQAIGYFDENRNRIFIYVGALAIIILAVILYMNYKSNKNEEASTQLARVITIYDGGAYLEAIEGKTGTKNIGLKKIVEQYGSTENGEIAKIYLANAYNNLGKLDEAKKYYEDYSGGSDVFKATALAGEAGYYASQKEYEKAGDLYKKAAYVSEENVMNADYLLRAGINFIDAGKKEEAKDLFNKIKKDYKTSTAFREIDKYLPLVDENI